MASHNIMVCCQEGHACLPKRYELAEAIAVADALYEKAQREGTRLTALCYAVFSDAEPGRYLTPVVSHVLRDQEDSGAAPAPAPAETKEER